MTGGCERTRGREDVGELVVVDAQLRTKVLDDPRGQRTGTGEGDLLADDRADRHLEPVDMTRHAQTRPGQDQRTEVRVGTEHRGDRIGVGVQVEQSPASLDGGPEVAQVGEPQVAPSSDRSNRCRWRVL